MTIPAVCRLFAVLRLHYRIGSSAKLKEGGFQGSKEASMCEQYVQKVATSLSQDRVWELLTDIQNWVHCSNTYAHLRWSGFPWERSSCILGEMIDPIHLHVRYVVEHAARPRTIRFIGHSSEAGFAVSATIMLQRKAEGTEITASTYSVGIPVIKLPGGPEWFQQRWSERFLRDFAAFCDTKASDPPVEKKREPAPDKSPRISSLSQVG